MYYCPICGKGVKSCTSLIACEGQTASEQHRCNSKTLRGIDAAANVEERVDANREPLPGRRLRDGFAMMEGEEVESFR